MEVVKDLNAIQLKLVNIFEDRFKRLSNMDAPKTILCTQDVFAKFQSIWPSEEYTAFDVYQVLSYLNVTGVSGNTEKYYWIFQE